MTEQEANEVMQFIVYLDTCILTGSDLAPSALKHLYDLHKLRDRKLYEDIDWDGYVDGLLEMQP